MSTIPATITDLVYRSLAGELDAAEQAQLDEWLAGSEKRRQWYEALGAGALSPAMDRTTEGRAAISADIHARIRAVTGVGAARDSDVIIDSVATRPVHRVHFLKTAWFRYAAAVLLFVGIGAAVWMISQKEKPTTGLVDNQTHPANTILPGSNKAVLTLSNGRLVELDSATVETINDGTLAIQNNNGQLVYGSTDLVAMNTMRTPKGGQYQLVLSDGTKVWLNAASSITYPTTFTSDNRVVKVTGEVFFDVAPNKSQPFRVQTQTKEITVLGTSFNVQAYSDEAQEKISLASGAIKIDQTVLQPGQAYVNGQVKMTNIDQDIAWTKGIFDFNDVSVTEAMKQVARWYNVDIRYEGPLPTTELEGRIDRNTSLNGLLKGLDGMVGHFALEKNTVVVRAL